MRNAREDETRFFFKFPAYIAFPCWLSCARWRHFRDFFCISLSLPTSIIILFRQIFLPWLRMFTKYRFSLGECKKHNAKLQAKRRFLHSPHGEFNDGVRQKLNIKFYLFIVVCKKKAVGIHATTVNTSEANFHALTVFP